MPFSLTMRKIRRRRAEWSVKCAELRADLGHVVWLEVINASKLCLPPLLAEVKTKAVHCEEKWHDYRNTSSGSSGSRAVSRLPGLLSGKLLWLIPEVM